MAGWHPDMTFWLNDAVDSVTEVVEWVYDNDADAWAATSDTVKSASRNVPAGTHRTMI